jgi:peptidylprolyl isomerase
VRSLQTPTTFLRILGLGTLLFGLAACGSDDDDEPLEPTPEPPAAAAPFGCWTDEQRIADVNGKPQWSAPPAMTIDQALTYTARVETSLGGFTVELLPQDAPQTVNSFVCLARAGFFDGIAFHRIVTGFVVQAGDPTGTGGGGPGYRFADELPTTRTYERGTLAMANAGPGTNGSQFFVCLTDLSQRFPPNYSIFGQVTEGMEAVDAIAAVPVQAGRSGEVSSPVDPVTITSVSISEA